MDAVKVGQAVASGMSIVCSTCKRYWEGTERGLPVGECTGPAGCGSPLAGDDFHGYEGPITDLTRWCFVCGESATRGIRVTGKQRIVGMCTEHVDWVKSLQAVGRSGQLPPRVVVGGTEPELVEDKKVVRKPSLGEVVVETEREWAEDDNRRK